MAQTYSEFKTYLTSMLWRQNDVDLANNLDKLIRMADSELNRKLDIQRREVTTTIAPEVEDFVLPSDFYQMVSLSNQQPTRQSRQGVMENSTFSNIQNTRIATSSTYIEPIYYAERSAAANTLYLVGPFSATDAGSFVIQYRAAVPDFEADDASWLEADFLDLYVYAVFKHCAIFLREDDRLQTYNALMGDALESTAYEDKHLLRFGGSPLRMQPHHYVPQTRRK
tara:strand:+ start:11504 stop:12178 length:675 start_codon:yes stop_codon:yes gene_type:complete